MTSGFTPKTEARTCTVIPNRIPLDQMNPPVNALLGRQWWAAPDTTHGILAI